VTRRPFDHRLRWPRKTRRRSASEISLTGLFLLTTMASGSVSDSCARAVGGASASSDASSAPSATEKRGIVARGIRT
jgi:hypothetical protein